MSSHNSTVEEILDQLADPYYSIAMEHHTDKFRDTFGQNWADFVDKRTESELTDTTREVFWAMGGAQNRCKPIGLFLDELSVVEKVDKDFSDTERSEKSGRSSAERKRQSLIEAVEFYSLWYENDERDYETPDCILDSHRAHTTHQYSEEASERMKTIVQPTIELLRQSRLTMPEFPTEEGHDDIEQYVAHSLNEIHISRKPSGWLRHD